MKTVQEFGNKLFEIEAMAHIAHLQTSSISQHLSLNELYQAMPELRDQFIEGWQGLYGIIKGYGSIKITEGVDFVNYLKDTIVAIREFRSTLTEGYLQQDVDDILQQLNQTNYKLRFLK